MLIRLWVTWALPTVLIYVVFVSDGTLPSPAPHSVGAH